MSAININSSQEEKQASTEGLKFDGDKPDMSLLSPVWIAGVSQVLTFGKRKYAAHNWRKGIAISRLMAAALRHIFAFIGGENIDPETGLSHLYHASCCLMFAAETMQMRPEFDDRWKPETKGDQCETNKVPEFDRGEFNRIWEKLSSDYKNNAR